MSYLAWGEAFQKGILRNVENRYHPLTIFPRSPNLATNTIPLKITSCTIFDTNNQNAFDPSKIWWNKIAFDETEIVLHSVHMAYTWPTFPFLLYQKIEAMAFRFPKDHKLYYNYLIRSSFTIIKKKLWKHSQLLIFNYQFSMHHSVYKCFYKENGPALIVLSIVFSLPSNFWNKIVQHDQSWFLWLLQDRLIFLNLMSMNMSLLWRIFRSQLFSKSVLIFW